VYWNTWLMGAGSVVPAGFAPNSPPDDVPKPVVVGFAPNRPPEAVFVCPKPPVEVVLLPKRPPPVVAFCWPNGDEPVAPKAGRAPNAVFCWAGWPKPPVAVKCQYPLPTSRESVFATHSQSRCRCSCCSVQTVRHRCFAAGQILCFAVAQSLCVVLASTLCKHPDRAPLTAAALPKARARRAKEATSLLRLLLLVVLSPSRAEHGERGLLLEGGYSGIQKPEIRNRERGREILEALFQRARGS